MNRNELVPTRVMDKNGRAMTVYKKATSLKGREAAIPAIRTESSPSIEETVTSYLQRIHDRSMQLSREAVNFPVSKLTQEHLRLAADLMDNPYAGKLMAPLIKRRMHEMDFMYLTVWLELMNRHFTTVMRSGMLSGNDSDESLAMEHIAALGTAHRDYRLSQGEDYVPYIETDPAKMLTPEQEKNVLLLRLAAWDSEIEGERSSSNGRFGMVRELKNNDLVAFALKNTWQDVAKACVLLKNGEVKSVIQLEAIVSNGVTRPVSEGWL